MKLKMSESTVAVERIVVQRAEPKISCNYRRLPAP